jgi:hypothetical protein
VQSRHRQRCQTGPAPSGAEPDRTGPEPGTRLMLDHDTGPLASAPAQTKILVWEQFWLGPDACTGPSGTEPGHAWFTPGTGFLFQTVVLPTNFVKVFRLI